MIFDTHMHTDFSTDSTMKIESAISQGTKHGIGIIITEHLDINFPREGEFVFDIDTYFKEYEKYRSKKVKLGIEFGMRMDAVEAGRKIEREYNFDYCIGSIHMVEDFDIYQEDYYIGKSKKETYEKYFSYMAECVKAYDFTDSLGHIDYISRYARYDDREIYFDDFSESIDGVLEAVIKSEKAMELNTRRLNSKAAAENMKRIYKRYEELGGKLITLGSDAHSADVIYSNFNTSLEILKDTKLELVYFEGRKPISCGIKL